MWALLLSGAVSLAVPFVPQEEGTCGAAALAMVMRYWQVPVSQDEIAAELYEQQLDGIRGSRLVEFARRRGLRAIAYEGDLAHLRSFLSKGRPVVVGWKVGRNRFHDVVVVGLDDVRGEAIVHDPAMGPSRRVAFKAFEKRWAASGHWALLVMPEAP
jgi:ABC-type bacteriocin/lantibiotic exporter with double-glycine peptidase domain